MRTVPRTPGRRTARDPRSCDILRPVVTIAARCSDISRSRDRPTHDNVDHVPAWSHLPAEAGQMVHVSSSPEIATPRPDRTTEPDYAAHRALATEFRGFAEQDIRYVARVICNRLERTGRLQVAHVTAELCRILCADISPDRDVTPDRDIAADIAALASHSDDVAHLAACATSCGWTCSAPWGL